MAYPCRVSPDDWRSAELRTLVGSGVAPTRIPTRARIPLEADRGGGGPGRAEGRRVGRVAGAMRAAATAIRADDRRTAESGRGEAPDGRAGDRGGL